MPQLRDFLDRFRPAGAPGSAATAGVPADRLAELAAELDPVLALLKDADSQCAVIVAEGEHEAERIAREAGELAARIAADGKERALAARNLAASEVLAQAKADTDRILRAATEAAGARSGRPRQLYWP